MMLALSEIDVYSSLSGMRSQSKGKDMKPKTARAMTRLLCLSTAIMITAVASQAAEPGALPAGTLAAAVKKDNTPIPASGVLSITFLGNKKFTNEQLQKVIAGSELKLGGKNGPPIIGPAMKTLVDFYNKNGANISASPNIIEDDRGIAFIQFVIDENASRGDIGGLVSSGGPHIFCKSTATAGSNGGAPDGATAGPPPGGAPGGTAVAKKDTTPIPSTGVVFITFLGNKKLSTEQLQKVVDGTPLKLGGPVNFSVVSPVMKSLVNLYKEKGLNLNISPNIIEDPKGIAAVQFIIDENGTKGDIGGFVSSGGPHIFCDN